MSTQIFKKYDIFLKMHWGVDLTWILHNGTFLFYMLAVS